jgi:hypothetical protein
MPVEEGRLDLFITVEPSRSSLMPGHRRSRTGYSVRAILCAPAMAPGSATHSGIALDEAAFDLLCRAQAIEHQLIRPNHRKRCALPTLLELRRFE